MFRLSNPHNLSVSPMFIWINKLNTHSPCFFLFLNNRDISIRAKKLPPNNLLQKNGVNDNPKEKFSYKLLIYDKS